MSVTLEIPFDSASNFTFDSDKIKVESGSASLKLGDSPGNDFVEDFADDTGHSYDATLEFSGGQLQVADQRPSGAVFYAKLADSIDANWCNGSETGTAYNGAAIVGNLLDLTGGVAQKYVSYDPTGNIPGAQTGCIRIENFKPNYSGIPATSQVLYAIGKDLSTKNYVSIYHYPNGYIRGAVFNSSGAIIGEALYYWTTAVAGQEYEIEFNYNIDTGFMYLFVNGVLQGVDTGAIGTRTDDITYMFIGRLYNPATPDFSIGKILVFDDMQHTTAYTPDWSTIYDTIYIEGYDTCPEMEWTGAGTLISFDEFLYTASSDCKVALQVGRSGLWSYWDGVQWATGDGTKNYMSSIADFAANVSSLDIEGEIYGQFKLYFPSGNTQGNISEFTASLTAQAYATDHPYLTLSQIIRMEELINFVESTTKTGSDNIKYILVQNATDYYHDGSSWVASDGTYTQTNTAAEILTNIATFITTGVDFNVKIFFHSANGTTTPSIQTLTLTYDFSGDAESDKSYCSVYFYARDPDGTICTETIYFKLSAYNVRYKDNLFVPRVNVSTTPNQTTSYVEIKLLENVNMVDKDGNAVTYEVYFGAKKIGNISVPVSNGAMLWDILQ